LYAICDERLGSGSIILTSNRPAEDWYSVFPDPVIGGAILDIIPLRWKNFKAFLAVGLEKDGM